MASVSRAPAGTRTSSFSLRGGPRVGRAPPTQSVSQAEANAVASGSSSQTARVEGTATVQRGEPPVPTGQATVFLPQAHFDLELNGKQLNKLITNKPAAGEPPAYVSTVAHCELNGERFDVQAYVGIVVKPAYLYTKKEKKAAAKATEAQTQEEADEEEDELYMFCVHLHDSIFSEGLHIIDVDSIEFFDASAGILNRRLLSKLDRKWKLTDLTQAGTYNVIYIHTPPVDRFGDDTGEVVAVPESDELDVVAPAPEEETDGKKKKKQKKQKVREDKMTMSGTANVVGAVLPVMVNLVQ